MGSKPTIELMDNITLVKGTNIDFEIKEEHGYITVCSLFFGKREKVFQLEPEDALAFGTALKERASKILEKK